MTGLATRTPEEIQAAESRAFASSALDAIQAVTTPEEAEALLARVKVAAEAARVMHLGKALSREWRGIEIKAERRWGELLGEADRSANAVPGPGRGNKGVSEPHTFTPAERTAVKEARKLAAVPEPVFEQYVETTETPTKAGLLRAAAVKPPEEAVLPPDTATLPELTTRQTNVANAARDRVDKTLHTLDGMCLGLVGFNPHNATLTATEEQITEWLAMAERARSGLRQFTALLRQTTS